MRRLLRRFGAWLVDWADKGVRIHYCMPRRESYGFTYTKDLTFDDLNPPIAGFTQLNRGETCYRCGEVNR